MVTGGAVNSNGSAGICVEGNGCEHPKSDLNKNLFDSSSATLMSRDNQVCD